MECWGPARLSIGRAAPRFVFFSSVSSFEYLGPSTERAPRETEAWEPPGLLAGPELGQEGPRRARVATGDSPAPAERLPPPSSGPAGALACGGGGGGEMRWSRGATAALNGPLPSGSEET